MAPELMGRWLTPVQRASINFLAVLGAVLSREQPPSSKMARGGQAPSLGTVAYAGKGFGDPGARPC